MNLTLQHFLDIHSPVNVVQTSQPIPTAPYQRFPAPNQSMSQGNNAPPPPYSNYGMFPPPTFTPPVAHGSGAVRVMGYSYAPPNTVEPFAQTAQFNTNSAMPSQTGYSYQPIYPTQEVNMKINAVQKVWQESPGYSHVPLNRNQTSPYSMNNFSNQAARPTWVEASGHTVPNGAFAGGVDKGGITLYVGRAKHRGSLTPGCCHWLDHNSRFYYLILLQGKVNLNHGCCYIAWGGSEHKKTSFEILVGKGIWSRCHGGRIPDNALKGDFQFIESSHLLMIDFLKFSWRI